MVDSFINKQRAKENGYNVTQCLSMFGVSDSGYYAWKGRKLDKTGTQAERKAERDAMKEKMRQIVIARNGVIPGKRTFREELFRRYGLTVNVKRIAALMKEMNLVAQKPHRDAYKHQASHNHICAAPENAVCRDFFIGPRRVILTDITYLYYGRSRNTFYLCVFRDAFTRENLGWQSGNSMNTALVEGAYRKMMDKHGDELKKETSVYVHSDQGSQYLSTTFKQLLEDDGFIQSVSARGNSQDNAPMESFFGRLKTDILDMVAMCRKLESARKLVDGYLKAYNEEHYQYNLAGLTPGEFYQYASTGIYPLESYFGVPAAVMMSTGELSRVRRIFADGEAKKRRETAREKRKIQKMIEPLRILLRDERLLEKQIRRWEESRQTADLQISNLKNILGQVQKAKEFLLTLTEEKREELKDPLAWRNYQELSYVFSMNELF